MSGLTPKTLVMFWGWGAGDRSHETITKSVPKGLEIIRLDYYQFIPKGDIADFKHQVNAYLKSKGVTSFSLMGHSLGGGFAIDFAAHYPESVEQLYLIDSVGATGQKDLIKTATHIFERPPRNVNAPNINLQTFITRVLRTPRFHAKLAHFAFTSNLEEEAAQIISPTTILWGAKDQVIPLAFGQRLNNIIPNSKLVVLPELKHDWIKFFPQLFWKHVG